MSDDGATRASSMEEGLPWSSTENRQRPAQSLSEVFASFTGFRTVWRRAAMLLLYVVAMTWLFSMVANGGLYKASGLLVASVIFMILLVFARVLHRFSARRAEARRRRQRIPRGALEARLQLRHPGIELGRLRLLLVDRDFTGEDYQTLLDLDETNEVPSTVGASEAQIRRNPSFLVKEPDPESTTKPKNCTICLYPFKPRERVRIIPCLHQFHTECIDPWLRLNAICPVCKFPVAG